MFKGDRNWRTMYNINLYTNAEGKEERDPQRPKSLSSSTSDNGRKLNTETRICNGKYLALAGEERFAGMGDSETEYKRKAQRWRESNQNLYCLPT